MRRLQIGDDFSLPAEAVTRRMAILAMSGAGKSNLAVVLAEQMFEAGVPWVAIDPKGDWFGVRSSKSGKGPGLPIPIFGGLHGDLPLEPAAGKLIGDLIVDQRLTCVLDVSEFTDRQVMWKFLSDLGETLLRRNRQVLHLFLEEADDYLPQKMGEKGNLPKCLGVWQRVVKRGRFRGIGTTQISQRSASLNKDALYQAEVLFALRVTGKGDRAAVAGWVEHHSGSEEIVSSLPTLADGEGWITSPAWLRETRRVRFDRRRTFDSGATPVLLEGRKSAPAATLADVDLDALRKRMAATIERAKAEDPRELRKRIGELEATEKRLRAQVAKPPAAVKPERVEVPALKDGQVAKLAKVVDAASALAERLAGVVESLRVVAREVGAGVARAQAPAPAPRVPVTRPPAAPPRTTPPRQVAAHSNGRLGAGEARVLTAIAQQDDGAARDQLTILTGYKRSTRDAYVQRLRTAGLVEECGGQIFATTEGIAALGADFEPLPTGGALRDYWVDRLPAGERLIFEAVVAAYPRGVERSALEEATGYKRSTRDAYIQRLQSRRLVEAVGPGEVRASEKLF